MNMNDEKWLEEKLERVTSIRRAKVPEGAFAKIQQKISKQNDEDSKSGFGWMGVAAMILLMISSNAMIVSHYLPTSEMLEQTEDLYVISDFSLYDDE